MVWCLVCRRVWQTDGVLSISHRGWDSGCGADTRQLPLSFPLSVCVSIFPFVIVKSLTSCTTGTETNSPLSRSLISTFCISFLLQSTRETVIFLSDCVLFSRPVPRPQTSSVMYLVRLFLLSLSLSLSLSLFFSLWFCFLFQPQSFFFHCGFQLVTCLSFSHGLMA